MLAPEMLEAADSAFISEHILVDDSIAPHHLLLKVGSHSVINPHVRIAIADASSDAEAGPAIELKRMLVSVGEYSIIADKCVLEIDDIRSQSQRRRSSSVVSPTKDEKEVLVATQVIGNYTYVDAAARIEPGVEIGDYCVVGAGCKLGRGVRVGNNCRVAAGTIIEPGTVVASKTAVSSSGGGTGRMLQTLDVDEDMDDGPRKREMKMHTEFLLKAMHSHGKRRH
ncbi:hypothetical protein BZA70DRAFT_186760 [Myxozyma melibiosi]|uniref:Dynactin subunit 6 n=1 Tax=Myxozyma melibiosi TaxID=54550 RepID=A0ABR1F4T4_9ASCO